MTAAEQLAALGISSWTGMTPPDHLVVLCLLVLVSLIAVAAGRRRFGVWVNPLSTFAVIAFLHNWSRSAIGLLVPMWWFPAVPLDCRHAVLWVNLATTLAFFAGAFLAFRPACDGAGHAPPSLPTPLEQRRRPLLDLVYVATTLLSIGLAVHHNALDDAYGAGQSVDVPRTSQVLPHVIALGPAAAVVSFTVRATGTGDLTSFVSLVAATEVFHALLDGTRKRLGFIFFAIALAYLVLRPLNRRQVLGLVGFLLLAAVTVNVVQVWRLSHGLPLGDRVARLATDFHDPRTSPLGRILATAAATDSEALQAWQYEHWFSDGNRRPTLGGASYLQALVNVAVPRQFQGPLLEYQAAYVFKRVAYPGMTSHGFDFAATAEGMLNFGPSLAFLPYLACGLWCGFLFRRRDHARSTARLAAFVLTMAVLAMTMRSDSTSTFRSLSVCYAVVLLFWISATAGDR